MTLVLVGLLAIAVAIVLVVLALTDPGLRERRAMTELVAAHGPSGVPVGAGPGEGGPGSPRTATDDDGPSGLHGALLSLAGRLVRHGSFAERLATRLDRAGLSWRVEEWLLLSAGITVGGVVVLSVLLGLLAGILVGLLVGLVGPRIYLKIATSRRDARFSSDLPDALQLVASGLASGYSLPQALNAVVSLGDGPISVEVGRALAQARLGTSVEDALAAVADRMNSKDFAWIVMAIRIQREVGGNLGDVLLSVATTIRDRSWLRRHVAALAAEGKLSGYILGGLPIGLAGYMSLVQPDYIGQLVTEPLGLAMLAGGVVLLILGALWMRSIVRIEM